MNALLFLIPVALFLGGLGLAAFIWSMKSGQFDDLEGAAQRILIDDDEPPKTHEDTRPDTKREEATLSEDASSSV